MEPAATTSAAPVAAIERESPELRASRLAAARRRATALLAAATVVFVAVTVAGVHGTALGYVQAGAEAAMVGGVADWFAVTALFRRPLGLPIPHTALIVERKDQFAATLGQFVQENFLNADVVSERIRSAGLVPRLAAWLADESNAAVFAGHAADLVVTVAETLRDEDVQRMLTDELTRVVDAVEVAPLAGKALRVVIAEGHHTGLFNAIVSGADRYLGEHYTEVRELFEGEAPRWVPDAVYRRVFDRLYTRLRLRLVAMAANPNDETRRQFEGWLAGLPDRLETSPELRERGERIKRDVLGSAELRDWSSSLWKHAKDTLRAQAVDPESELRRQLATALVAAAGASNQTAGSPTACCACSTPEPGRLPTGFTTNSPDWSREPSSDGTRNRRQASWNCSSAVICSSSASTAPWWAPAWAWRCTPSAWPWPKRRRPPRPWWRSPRGAA